MSSILFYIATDLLIRPTVTFFLLETRTVFNYNSILNPFLEKTIKCAEYKVKCKQKLNTILMIIQTNRESKTLLPNGKENDMNSYRFHV